MSTLHRGRQFESNALISPQPIPSIWLKRIFWLVAMTMAISMVSHGFAQQTNQILSINPDSASAGTNNLLVTFTLDTDFPPPPPAGDGPQSVTIGSISGSSITHTNQSTVTAIFNIPANEPQGAKDVAISFSIPGGTLICSITGGFRVTGSGEQYNIERTLSDGAQRNTIAFDGLAFLTGTLGGQSFLPPGKVADYSGFQYLRDNDPTQLGHNTSFVTRVAFNVLHILTQTQIDQMVARAQTQVSLINEYAYQRFPLMDAFRRLIDGEIPSGSTGLDRDSVRAYSGRLYLIDGQISYNRAELLGGIIRNMTTAQRQAMDSLTSLNGVGHWDSTLSDPLQGLHLDPDVNVAVMTYASEMYSWYAGSIDADVYFCPERQGTYFGSFYLKDWPAMGNPNYTINEQLTAEAGEDFIRALTTSQAAYITGLVDSQRTALYDLVDRRRDISTQLRRFMTEESIDSNLVMSLSEQYGVLDGEIVYLYATYFSQVGHAVSDSQLAIITSISDSLGYLPAAGAFLYSRPINMPVIPNTDFLFEMPSGGCDYVIGDINGDGHLAGADVTYGVRYFKGTGTVPPDSCYLDSTGSFLYVAGDCNGNCEFRGSDITRLVAYFKGLAMLNYCHFFPTTLPPLLRAQKEGEHSVD